MYAMHCSYVTVATIIMIHKYPLPWMIYFPLGQLVRDLDDKFTPKLNPEKNTFKIHLALSRS